MMNINLTSMISAVALLMAAPGASAETLRIGGTGVALGGMARLAEAFSATRPDVTVGILPSLGSSGGVKAVLAGAIDLGLSSRELKPAEVAAGAEARIYAHTPLAVVTTPTTATDGVSSADLEAIYRGSLTHWPDGSPIRVVMRPSSETDTQLLRQLSDRMAAAVDAAMERPGLVSATNDQENADTLEDLAGSLGLVALGQLAAESRNLKVLALDGQLPDLENIAHGDAPFSKTLHFVTNGVPTGVAADFMAFVFSEDGAAVLLRYAHCPKI